ncbi:MAG TPA: DNA topoisomerase IB [Candidatus Saccharimonadales bacterium]|nr:DNA topoisomerase IB [Candidatus Saccharimonadales bacterium]
MQAIALASAAADAIDAAKAAGLRYVSDDAPGITRARSGRGFSYRDPAGALIRDRAEVARIRRLAIPPAWTSVWICANPLGHLQATGRDARGRKQYRYHDRWREVRDGTKYGRMIDFGAALPKIRTRTDTDLRRQGLPREKVLATVVRLLEGTLIRVGNEEYAKENRSFGLTTMQNRHVDVSGGTMLFRFRGKSGVQHEVDVRDRRLAPVVRRCQELPGQDLFQYVGDDGEPHGIGSDDVNAYVKEISGEDFTAKDFRTWAGTVLAVRALEELDGYESEAEAKRQVQTAVESVARRLGNTRAVCRKCYIHPAVLEAYLDGSLRRSPDSLRRGVKAPERNGLTAEEGRVLRVLKARVAAQNRSVA